MLFRLVIVVVGVFIGLQVSNSVVQFDQLVQGAERAAEVITDIWRENLGTIDRHATFIERVSDDGRELLSHEVEYDVPRMRADSTLVPALAAVLRSNRLEVVWRTGVADAAAELRRRLAEDG